MRIVGDFDLTNQPIGRTVQTRDLSTRKNVQTWCHSHTTRSVSYTVHLRQCMSHVTPSYSISGDVLNIVRGGVLHEDIDSCQIQIEIRVALNLNLWKLTLRHRDRLRSRVYWKRSKKSSEASRPTLTVKWPTSWETNGFFGGLMEQRASKHVSFTGMSQKCGEDDAITWLAKDIHRDEKRLRDEDDTQKYDALV